MWDGNGLLVVVTLDFASWIFFIGVNIRTCNTSGWVLVAMVTTFR